VFTVRGGTARGTNVAVLAIAARARALVPISANWDGNGGPLVRLKTANQISEDGIIGAPREVVKATPFTEGLVERDHRIERVGGKKGMHAITIKDKLRPLKFGVAFSGIPKHLQVSPETIHGNQPK